MHIPDHHALNLGGYIGWEISSSCHGALLFTFQDRYVFSIVVFELRFATNFPIVDFKLE
jgi:hypothetical protein